MLLRNSSDVQTKEVSNNGAHKQASEQNSYDILWYCYSWFVDYILSPSGVVVIFIHFFALIILIKMVFPPFLYLNKYFPQTLWMSAKTGHLQHPVKGHGYSICPIKKTWHWLQLPDWCWTRDISSRNFKQKLWSGNIEVLYPLPACVRSRKA